MGIGWNQRVPDSKRKLYHPVGVTTFNTVYKLSVASSSYLRPCQQGCTKFIIWVQTDPENTGHIVSDRTIVAILSQIGKYWTYYLRPENTVWIKLALDNTISEIYCEKCSFRCEI